MISGRDRRLTRRLACALGIGALAVQCLGCGSAGSGAPAPSGRGAEATKAAPHRKQTTTVGHEQTTTVSEVTESRVSARTVTQTGSATIPPIRPEPTPPPPPAIRGPVVKIPSATPPSG